MAVDRHGVWTPLCDREGCRNDRAPDGLLEVVAFVGAEVATVRVHLCAGHRDRAITDARALAA